MASGCHSPQEQRRDEAASSPSGDAPAGAGAAVAGAARTVTAGVLGRGKRGHSFGLLWLASDGLCIIVHIEAETLTCDPYYRDLQQDAPLERRRQERSRVAVDQQFPPSLKGQHYWGRPWAYVDCPVEDWQVFVKA